MAAQAPVRIRQSPRHRLRQPPLSRAWRHLGQPPRRAPPPARRARPRPARNEIPRTARVPEQHPSPRGPRQRDQQHRLATKRPRPASPLHPWCRKGRTSPTPQTPNPLAPPATATVGRSRQQGLLRSTPANLGTAASSIVMETESPARSDPHPRNRKPVSVRQTEDRGACRNADAGATRRASRTSTRDRQRRPNTRAGAVR